MRRRRAIRQKPQHRTAKIAGAIFTAFAALVWGVFCHLDNVVQPVLQDLAEYECRAVMVRAMNRAVEQSIAAEPEQQTAIYQLQRNDSGRVTSLITDTAAANRDRLALVAAVEAEIHDLPEQETTIPLGSLVNYPIFNDFGPDWLLTLHPQGYVESALEESSETLSINTTRYTTTLVLQATVNMLLNGRATSMVVENRVPLASVLLTGDVPTYYSRENG